MTDFGPDLRLRFAPSPTGYLHVGGARTALFNWLLARRSGGKFLLRVEDTDKARSTDESTRAIFDGLKWLGLDWDEEVVFQGANLERHRADALRLLAEGNAYRCFCTSDELNQRRAEAEARKEVFTYDRRCDRLSAAEVEQRVAAGAPFTVRFRVPDGETAWDDLVHERIAFPNKDVDDLVILRSDGTPIYNLAVVSDDIAMGITLVMRGDDHISNTPKQILLYRALGAPLPRFAHLPMILGPDGKKLSKRHGATAVGDYQYKGILASAMVNFLALLGWSPGGQFNEVMTVSNLRDGFSVDGLLKKASVFDTRKLEWMNGKHIADRRILSDESLEALVDPLVVEAGLTSEAELDEARGRWRELLSHLRVRMRVLNDVVSLTRPLFKNDFDYDEKSMKKHWSSLPEARNLLAEIREALDARNDWGTLSGPEAALEILAEKRGLKFGAVLQTLRVALYGSDVSPGIFEMMLFLLRDGTIERIERAEAYLSRRIHESG